MSTNSSDNFTALISELIPSTCSCSYCFLKFFIKNCHPDQRMLVQLKCIEKFKWEQSEQNRHDCGWEEAILQWADKGYAEAFDKCYSSSAHIDDIYAHCHELVNNTREYAA